MGSRAGSLSKIEVSMKVLELIIVFLGDIRGLEFSHKASTLKPLNSWWWKQHVSNDLHMLLQPQESIKGAGGNRRELPKISQQVQSSPRLMVQKYDVHQLSLIVYPMIYKVLCLPSGCLGFPSTVWTSRFDDFLKLDHLIQRSSPLGKNSSWWRPKQNAVRWLFLWEWDSFGSSWIQVCHYKSDVEVENDGFQTKSSVRVHFQVHANGWEFHRNVVETTPFLHVLR